MASLAFDLFSSADEDFRCGFCHATVVEHMDKCGFAAEACPLCGESQLRHALAEHQTARCKRRLVKCEHCDETFEAAELEAKHSTPGAQLPCKGLALCPNACLRAEATGADGKHKADAQGRLVLRASAIRAHLETCLLQPVACDFCGAQVARRGMEQHVQAAVGEHMAALLRAVKGGAAGDAQQAVRALEARVAELENANKELTARVVTLEQQAPLRPLKPSLMPGQEPPKRKPASSPAPASASAAPSPTPASTPAPTAAPAPVAASTLALPALEEKSPGGVASVLAPGSTGSLVLDRLSSRLSTDGFFEFTVPGLSKLSGEVFSPQFQFANHAWKLGIIKSGNQIGTLIYCTEGPMPFEAKARFMVRHATSDKLALSRQTTFREHQDRDGWGLHPFATLEELTSKKAYDAKDDTVIFGCVIIPGRGLRNWTTDAKRS